jgi:hypothetical protein
MLRVVEQHDFLRWLAERLEATTSPVPLQRSSKVATHR